MLNEPQFEIGDHVFAGGDAGKIEGVVIGFFDLNYNLVSAHDFTEYWPRDWHYVVRHEIQSGNFVCVNYNTNELRLKRKVRPSEMAIAEERATQFEASHR